MDNYIQELVEKNRGKDIRDLIYQERISRPNRVRESFMRAKDAEVGDFGTGFELLKYYALLALKEDCDYANRKIYELLTSTDEKVIRRNSLQDKWSLWLNPIFIRLYMYFGSSGSGVLSMENEELILKLLWERMLYKNDIHVTKNSTWHLTGSENHDLNFKICALISSQIFKNHPDYQDKIYPDLGRGAGSGYWFHHMYEFMGGDKNDYGPEGRADVKDQGAYNALDHYNAWTAFFKEYIRERAKRGFFLEASSSGYMKWTLSFISLLFEFCEDEELRNLACKFYDLIWYEWAQEQINGRRGGARTRALYDDNSMQNDSMYHMAKFWLGGSCNGAHAYYFQLLSNYELPEIVWDMVINRHEMGSYEYYSRRPGEEQMIFPRPFGNERTLICNPDSRMLHYSYITQDYILGTQFDHPYAIHSHLSCANRWNGLILRDSPDSYIYPSTFEKKEDSYSPAKKMYRSVQYKNVLICAPNTGYFTVNPEWFPQIDNSFEAFGFVFGKKYDISQIGEWFILKDSNHYIGLRPAYGNAEVQGDRMLVFTDKFAPAIIHIEKADEFKDSEEFFKYLCEKCTLKVNNTVVPGFYTLDYYFNNTSLYFNAANNEPPRINGNRINYEYPYTFESPFICGEYGSGVITVSKGSRKVVLDFN